jgi:hypothetical protein
MGKIEENVGFNPPKTLNAESSTLEHMREQLPDKIRQLPHMIRHPGSAAKQKTAKTLATSEEPYLSREDDECLVTMHEKLKQAEAAKEMEDGKEEQVYDLQEKVNEIEESRKQKKVALTSSRYIHRARVVKMGQDKFSIRSSFRWRDSKGELQGYKWSQWFDQIKLLIHSLYGGPHVDNTKEDPDWDGDMLLQQVKRLVRASSPWQKWLMQVQKLQRWDNPTRSATWFLIWSVVWYEN